MAAAGNPLVAKVLGRYPDVNGLEFPPDTVDWTEMEIDLFIGSGGFLKPKRKKAVPVVAATPSLSPSTAGYSSSAPVLAPVTPPASALQTAAASTAKVLAVPNGVSSATPAASAAATAAEPAVAASTSAVPPWQSPVVADIVRVQRKFLQAEVELMQTEGKQWVVPLTTFMEDVGPRGLRMVAALNKCERSRSAALMKGANFDLRVLKETYGTGILLREFALEVASLEHSDIMSVLWCETCIELPCSPFIPMTQALVPASGGTAVCTGRFNLVLVDMQTMSVVNDTNVYERVAVPLRQSLGIPKPSGKEGVPKFPRIYPSRGRPFAPQQLMKTNVTLLPSDCDMYRVIFHPEVASICERVNFSCGLGFREEPGVAIYANLSKPASAGTCFEVFVFIEHADGQARALYLFANKGGSGAAAVTMAVFGVYGPPPGRLASEDVSACAATKFALLHGFAALGKAGGTDKDIDLSKCSRSS
ncbi:unnamed protein product [Polarella glacialis]|uniref:Uncharacterized protein n=1 Tax=Polarella glacialis TaxID=89957 RepID=A0A813E6Q0_POLGL|nr:unnamed protein product [Polarella glacialis]CAE8654318.1 unnamed protein product [Polarella glacialis]